MKTVQVLPIDPLIPEIVRSIAQNPITLLQAEPGAGKTTRVPPALVAAGLSDVYVLEPRRLAARMAARRIAQERNERIGAAVGYQVRFEEAGSKDTRLWYVTEGVLNRKLLSQNALPCIRVAVLDEFHERHLETDLALALLRKLQESKPDLRLLIMSATLPDDLSGKLNDPPLIRAPGRLFPVDIRYTPHSAVPLEERATSAISRALQETKGHVLVFLPGAAEIRKTMQACEPLSRKAGAMLLPLHGDLSSDQQDAAVAQSDVRKIICSTNVAESSITIDGVQAVIDSGLARRIYASRKSAELRRSSAVAVPAGLVRELPSGSTARRTSSEDRNRFRPRLRGPILRTCCCYLWQTAYSWSNLSGSMSQFRKRAREFTICYDASVPLTSAAI